MIGIGLGIPLFQQGGFSPASLGTPLLWLQGDDATWDGTAELGAGVYSSLTNRGSLGGTVASVANNSPIAVNAGGRNAPTFRGTRRMLSSLAPSEWKFFHDNSSNCTICIRFYNYELAGLGQWLFSTYGGGAGSAGIAIYIVATGYVVLQVTGGTADNAANSVGTITDNSWNDVVITKSGTSYTVSLNGETPVALTLADPSASNPVNTLTLGAYVNGTTHFRGILPEAIVFGSALGADDKAKMRSYMAAKWSGAPAYSPLQGTADLIQWLVASKGTTIATGISAWADQSGYNNDVVQATAGYQPALTPSAINGLPGSTGDGSDDLLLLSAFTNGPLSQPITRYMAAYRDTWSSNRIFACSGDGASRLDIYNPSTAPIISGFAGATLNNAVSGPSLGSELEDVPLVTRWLYNGASSHGRTLFDGYAESSASGDTGASGLVGSSLHAYPTIGVSHAHSTICESMIFSGTAGSNTAASDVHDVVLRAKYAVEPA